MKKALSLVLTVLLLCATFLGCQSQEESLRQVELNEVTRSVFYAPQYVAVTLGFFEEEGLEVSITNGGGSDKTMTALLSGEADIGLMGPETGVYVVNEGKEDHPVVIGQLTKRDGSFLISRMEEPDFQWESLKGKTIIGGRKGGMPFMTLLYVLQKHGLTPGVDVEVLDGVQFNLFGGGFEGGMGDFVSLFEPTASMYELEGKGYIVANVGEASGEIPYTTYMVSQNTLKNDPEFVEHFLRAIYKAQQWIQTASDEEVADAMLPFFPDTDVSLLATVVYNYRTTDSWTKMPIMEEEAYQRLLDVMENAGELTARPEFSDLIDNTIAQKVVGQ